MTKKERNRVNICDILIDRISFNDTVDSIIEYAQKDFPPAYVVTPNAHHIVTLQSDIEFKRIYKEALLVVPDGVSLIWASKLLGSSLQERVNGTDLFEAICSRASQEGLTIFLLGGRPGAAQQAKNILQTRNPGLIIVGIYCPPYGFENDSVEINKINNIISGTHPDILFVGLGAPKQEKWIYTNISKINVPISIGIGVSFEFVAGMVKRAPLWMQKAGLEWLYRLISEPKRLWHRYLFGNIKFIMCVLSQKLKSFR